MDISSQYRGKWGGKIANGEEMWWSEPSHELSRSKWKRLRFSLDLRHHFILRFWRAVPKTTEPLAIADFGCGTGGTTLNFSEMFRNPITGVDIFATQLQIARQFASSRKSRCEFKQIGADGALPFASSTLDAILSLDVLGHVPSIPQTLQEFARVLKSGGTVLLFTESIYSSGDRSLVSRLAARGADMMQAVPEHISLYPREVLERMFGEAGFEVRERFSANVWHFFFFPKDYMLLLRGKQGFGGYFALAWAWNRISKLTPFYPLPFSVLQIIATHLWGKTAFGTSYFYRLKKKR